MLEENRQPTDAVPVTRSELAGYPRWFWLLAIAALFLSSLPFISGALKPRDETEFRYLGVHSNFVDNAVYASWMHQAQEGKFFFENRFTTEEQPRLTVQLYFWVTGLLSTITGIPLAMHIGRLVFALLFLMALFRLVRRATGSDFARQVAMAVTVFGAGIAWTYWTDIGRFARVQWAGVIREPIDLWQPEAFTFPSLMTSGLFCAALWLMVVIWNKILDARQSWKPVLAGALATLVLTNIHTYDTLTIALVGLGFLASQVAARNVTTDWLVRVAVIAAGALPALLWFLYVRSVDPVFAERAATPTFSPRMFDILLGYGPLLILALLALWLGRYRMESGEDIGWGAPVATAALFLLVGIAIAQGDFAGERLWLGPLAWLALFAAMVALCYLLRPSNPVYGLLFAWLLVGIAVLYYPGFFQRKLAMGLSIPIGILAGLSLAWLLEGIKRAELRHSAAMVLVVLLSITSLSWLLRETRMAKANLSNTEWNRVYLTQEEAAIVDYLNENAKPGDVVLALPGQSTDLGFYPDLNPVVTGWAGMKTYAGHWSETPNYDEKRSELIEKMQMPPATQSSLQELIEQTGADYLITLENGSVPDLPEENNLKVISGDDVSLYRLGSSPATASNSGS